MPTIDRLRDICTVIVTVDASADDMPDLTAHARNGLTLFAEFPGFLGGATHLSNDDGRIVQYLQWESEEAHLACQQDSRWDHLPSTRRFMEIIHSGRAALDVRTYRVLASTDDPAPRLA